MHPHAEVITRFYTAFQRRDAAGMAACYHPRIQFSDPVFPDLRGRDVALMWGMLCRRGQDLRIHFDDVEANDQAGTAEWQAWYTFSATGRPVHNRISAEFAFHEGTIIRHIDRFSFWRWARQALGPVGRLLGWSGLVRDRVRKQARAALAGERVDLLSAIGNTSMVRLRKVVPPGCADVYVKLEWENPTGSMKDRMAQAVIARAEDDGRLKPGDTVVEYTGGSTGASLALVCAARGYRIRIVTSDAFSPEKRDQMAAFGAELTLVPSEDGRTTKQLILNMIEAARALARAPHTYWTDQLNNHDAIAGYHPLGEEIWRQTSGRVDAFVHCVGTAASLRGVAAVLRRHKPGITIVAVEPAESSVLLGNQPGPHKIEGVGIGYTPPLWDPSLVDDILAVPTDAAKDMARRLAREEGLFAGTSSGANVVAAIEVATRLGPGRAVVTLMVDSGLKYLNTDVYRK